MTEPHSPCPQDRELERINYVHGMLLTETDLKTEQAYFLDKDRAHNRLHGWGTICGLSVEPTQPPSSSVLVQPGLAIDCCGREIVLNEAIPLDVIGAISGIGQRETVLVVIEYGETECSPTPALGDEELGHQSGRVRETPHLSVAGEFPEGSLSSPPTSSGVVECPDCQNPALTLAAIDLPTSGPITAVRIDNNRRRIVPLWGETTSEGRSGTDLQPVTAQEVAALRRHITALTAAAVVLAVGVMTSLLRGQRGGQR